MGDGHFNTSGDDLADGVFEAPSGRVAVCAFSIDPILGHIFGVGGRLAEFIDAIVVELVPGNFQKVLLVFDGELDTDSDFAKQIESRREIVKEEMFARISVVDGELEEVLESITKELAASSSAA